VETSDFGLMVALKTIGFPIKKVSNDIYDRNKKIAYFDMTDELDETVKKYWKGELMVDAKTLSNNIRDVKTELQIRSQF